MALCTDWYLSKTIKLKKPKNKKGPQGIRLIHVLDCCGTAFFKQLWTSGRGRAKKHFSRGFTRRRRREDAIMQMKCLACRLRTAKRSHLLKSYDCSNAFPSLEDNKMDKKIEEGFEEEQERELMKSRHRLSVWEVFGLNEYKFLLCAGCGGMAGDACMPDQFVQIYDEKLEGWQHDTRTNDTRRMSVHEEVTGEQVQVDMASYADDVCRIMMANSLAGFDAVCLDWDAELDGRLAPCGLIQNLGEQEIFSSSSPISLSTSVSALWISYARMA